VSSSLAGRYLAVGQVITSRGGGALRPGERIQRVWLFRLQCGRRGCRTYWIRTPEVGVFTAPARVSGDNVSATFAGERARCTSGNGSTHTAIGRLTSVLALHFDPATRTGTGTEHTFATTSACRAVDQRLRWTARPINPRRTREP
jgi:hypothetical protein